RALATRDCALARQVDHRADIYSLGVVLFEMLTGRRPFAQNASYLPLPALIEAMAAERNRMAPSPRACRPDIPWSLESIVRKCLPPDPLKRYQQAEHLLHDLSRFLENRPLRHAPELSWAERIVKWGRRHPRLMATCAVAAAALFLFSLGGAALTNTWKQLRASRARIAQAE